IRWHFQYVASVAVGIAVVSLPVMLMQLVGWPSWINALATHGYEGGELRQTLFLSFSELKAIYWQTRPAGVFSSNQYNTIVFFVLLPIALAKPGRRDWLLIVPALYAVISLSKAAIFGSAAFFLLIAWLYGREHKRQALIYCACLAVSLAVYYAFFPGVI